MMPTVKPSTLKFPFSGSNVFLHMRRANLVRILNGDAYRRGRVGIEVRMSGGGWGGGLLGEGSRSKEEATS